MRAYRRAGGAADAVNRSAEAAYGSLGSQQQDAARMVFTQLTTITLDGQFERRRCSRTELRSLGVPVADIDTVIDVFSAQRLLVLGEDSVEISHDILLQAWKQLRDWLGDDQLDRALYGQVVTDAQTWDTNGRDPSYLYRPGRLAAIDAAVARWENAPTRYPPLPPAGKAFLGAAHHAARQNLRWRRSAFAALAVLTVLAIVASGVAFHQRAAAVQQRDQAIYNQVIAEALQSGNSDTSLAAQLDLAAYRINPTQDLASRLLDTENTPLPSTLAADAGFVNAVAFSPDVHTLASGNSDGTIRLWNVTDPAHPSPLGQPLSSGPGENAAGGPDSIMTMAFSPDGHVLASSDSNESVRLWSVADPAHSQPLGQPLTGNQAIDSLAFSENGHVLVGGGDRDTDDAGTMTLWDVADPAHPRPLGQTVIGTSNTDVYSVAISPDGRTVADGAYDGTLRLWNVGDPTRPHPLGPSLTSSMVTVQAVAFSPDGHTLVSGDYNGTIRLWNVTDPARPRPLASDSTGGAAVESMAFSPDGHTLASGTLDGIIQLWNVADPTHPFPLGQPLTGGTRAVESMAFSPDGRTLASGNLDGIIRLWTLPQTVLTGSAVGLNSVAFSPDGRTLASGDNGTAIRLWDVADLARPQSLGPSLADGGGADSVAFSPDERTLASGDYGGTIRLWNIADPIYPRPLGQPLIGGGAEVGSVAFSPDGSMMASGSFDGTTRLWDVAKPADPEPLGQPLTSGTVPVDSVAFSPDGRTLASGSDDGTTRLWNLDVQYAINRICATTGGLTSRQWDEYVPQLPYKRSCTH
jgi:WD40 repeat protein